MNFNKTDNDYFKANDINNIFIKFFDISYDQSIQQAIPISMLNNDGYYCAQEFIPVVYIENDVFTKISKHEIDSLAFKTVKKINIIAKSLNEYRKNKIKSDSIDFYLKLGSDYNEIQHEKIDASIKQLVKQYREIQIDCDWTESTKEKYFYFLTEIKKHLFEAKLSCTLKLHQYKYRTKTGIPPVDKVMLLCYNMDEMKDENTPNSIINKDIALEYLIDKPYPIPMDVGLPTYDWGLLYSNNKFKGIINDVKLDFLLENKYIKQESTNQYLFIEEAVFGDHFVRKGDILKVEKSNEKDIKEIIKKLKSIKNNTDSKIAFFHYDNKTINEHNIKDYINLYY